MSTQDTDTQIQNCSSCGASFTKTLAKFHGDGRCPYCGN